MARARGTPARTDRTFIGRADELSQLAALLSSHRLLTIRGTAGIGKTRLALRHLASVCERDEGAGCFCDLSDASGVEDVCRIVGSAIELPLLPADDAEMVAQLGRALDDRGALLVVLDNFEALVEHAAATVGAWLAATDEARFLVTSREALRLTGEHVVDLAPLGLPPDSDQAVELFVDRSRAIGATVGDADRAVVADIVRQLDGIPLAIELAAARAAVLTPAELRERLSRGLGILGSGSRDDPARQRTLQGAIEWSWNLLAPWERAALSQCTVFRGGWSLEAAEAVVDLSPFPEAPPAVDVLQALRDKSLLTASRVDDRMRLGMYASVHQYASAQLDSSAARAAEVRHAAHYVAWLEEMSPRTQGPDGAVAARLVARQQENVTLAIDRLLARAAFDPDALTMALRAFAAMEATIVLGCTNEMLALLDRALDRGGPPPGIAPLHARVLAIRGRTRRYRGRIDGARADLERAAAMAREAGDASLEGTTRSVLGLMLFQAGQPDAGIPELEAALSLLERSGTSSQLGNAFLNLAIAKTELGDLESGRAASERALELLADSGPQRTIAAANGSLALIQYCLGRNERALELHGRAARVFRDFGDLRNVAIAIGNMACANQDAGRIADALAGYDEAIAMFRRFGYPRGEHQYLAHRGTALHESGDLAGAIACYDEALAGLRRDRDRRREGIFLGHFGGALAAVGRVEEAAEAFSRANEILAGAGDPSASWVSRIHQGHLDLAASRPDDAVARADAARDAGLSSPPVRTALRILDRALRGASASTAPKRAISIAPPAGAGPDLWMDPRSARVVVDGDREIDLRKKPLLARLLAVVMGSPTSPFDKARLFAEVWGGKFSPLTQSTTVYKAVDRLARLISPDDPRRFLGWDEQGMLVLRARRPVLAEPKS